MKNKEKLTMIQKVELIIAAEKLAKFWGMNVPEFLAIASLSDETKMEEWNALVQDVIDFKEGIDIYENKDSLTSPRENKK